MYGTFYVGGYEHGNDVKPIKSDLFSLYLNGGTL
jgi:hypothetical protein